MPRYIVHIPSDARGAKRAQGGAGAPPPGAARAPQSPQLRDELLGQHKQHLLHLVARPVVQAHDLVHAEIDELEQLRPAQ